MRRPWLACGPCARYGDTDPLWVTETGFSTPDVSEAVQADALRRLYNRLVTMPDVGGVLVHTLREPSDGASGPGVGYGLLHADGTVKPAYCQLVGMAGLSVSGCPA